MILTLPWPPKQLSPNARHAHWATLAKAKKAYRHACALTAKSQGARALQADKLPVAIVFYPPDRRKRDRDNLVAAFKAGADGIADVIGVDDGKWIPTYDVAEETGGFVRVEIRA